MSGIGASGSSGTSTSTSTSSSNQESTSSGVSLLEKLSTMLSNLIGDATSLEVRTYTSDAEDASLAREADPLAKNTRLRAFTRISVDGDIDHAVPVRGAEIDQALWQAHAEVVKQAQEARERTIGMVISAVQSLSKLRG